MSQRTSEANKAIAAAWADEKQRVLDGQGTRDWSPKQQQDIIDRGKAYDDDGRAFEGHHMKSVGKYPEYQGEPGNIQFLTKAEHKEAHFGSFHNYTNGYYDPIACETVDFGDGEFVPCEVIDLSEPITFPRQSENVDKKVPEETSTVKENDNLDALSDPEVEPAVNKETALRPKPVKKRPVHIDTGKRLLNFCKEAGTFVIKNPRVAIKAAVYFGGFAAEVYRISKGVGSGSGIGTPAINSKPAEQSASSVIDKSINIIERASPREHTVNGYYRMQNGKRVFVNKYTRGGK